MKNVITFDVYLDKNETSEKNIGKELVVPRGEFG